MIRVIARGKYIHQILSFIEENQGAVSKNLEGIDN